MQLLQNGMELDLSSMLHRRHLSYVMRLFDEGGIIHRRHTSYAITPKNLIRRSCPLRRALRESSQTDRLSLASSHAGGHQPPSFQNDNLVLVYRQVLQALAAHELHFSSCAHDVCFALETLGWFLLDLVPYSLSRRCTTQVSRTLSRRWAGRTKDDLECL
jgi:hypothetical protein